jgi:hypothetical protein
MQTTNDGSREPPARILRVWLIALSMFQHGEGQGEYGAIEFPDR